MLLPDAKRGKIVSDQAMIVVSFHLIGVGSGESFADQSQNEVKGTQSKHEFRSAVDMDVKQITGTIWFVQLTPDKAGGFFQF